MADPTEPAGCQFARPQGVAENRMDEPWRHGHLVHCMQMGHEGGDSPKQRSAPHTRRHMRRKVRHLYGSKHPVEIIAKPRFRLFASPSHTVLPSPAAEPFNAAALPSAAACAPIQSVRG